MFLIFHTNVESFWESQEGGTFDGGCADEQEVVRFINYSEDELLNPYERLGNPALVSDAIFNSNPLSFNF